LRRDAGKELESEIQQQTRLGTAIGRLAAHRHGEFCRRRSSISNPPPKYLERASQTMSPDALVDRLRDFLPVPMVL